MFILTGEVTAAKESLLQCDKYNDAVLHFGDYADVDTDGMLPETTFHLRRKSPFAVRNRSYILDNSLCCEVLPGAENNSGTVLCQVYRKMQPFFDTLCDSRLVRTYLANVHDTTVEATSTTRLRTQAIMVKIGSGFDVCFMAILH